MADRENIVQQAVAAAVEVIQHEFSLPTSMFNQLVKTSIYTSTPL